MDDFNSIPDVLTQRSFRSALSEATVRVDLSGMMNGQEAGLAHFANAYCTLSVVQTDGLRQLSYNSNGTRTMGPRLDGNILYLRSTWNYAGESQSSYSTDGHDYRLLGPLTWGAYRGDRVGLFTVGSREVGYIDVDWFHYEVGRRNQITSRHGLTAISAGPNEGVGLIPHQPALWPGL
jgi:hypothetical protein